jgi:hypothetical protein
MTLNYSPFPAMLLETYYRETLLVIPHSNTILYYYTIYLLILPLNIGHFQRPIEVSLIQRFHSSY